MARAIQAKRHSLQDWGEGTRASYPPAPVLGGAPVLSLTPGATSMGINLSASPPVARTIVAWEVRRLIAAVWTTLALAEPVGASEIPARDTRAPTKWVHPSGTLDGHTAYTTVEAADAAAVPGDVIVVHGTFNSRGLIDTPGTAGARIYWRAFDYDNPPVFDGQETVNPPGWSGARGSAHLLAVQASYVTIDGFHILNSKVNGLGIGNCDNNGSYIPSGGLSTWYVGIEVYRCRVRNQKGTALTTWMAQDYKVAGNDFSEYRFSTYWDQSAGNPPFEYGSLINIAGRNGTFVENDVHDAIGEGIHIGAHINVMEGGYPTPQGSGAKGFTIRRNRIWNCFAPHIYMTVGQDGLIEQNLVYGTDDDRFWYGRSNATGFPQFGIVIGSELGAFGNPTAVFDGVYSGVARVKIRNNIVNGLTQLFKIIRYSDDSRYVDCEIDHNTIMAPKGAFASIYSALFNECTAANLTTGFRVRNNCVAVSDASDVATTWNALGAGKVVQGNVFSHSPPSDLAAASNIIDGGSTVLDDKNYSVTGVDWPSVPTFNLAKAAPYRSSSVVSPAVNAVDAIGVTVDFYGRTRPLHTGKVDAGAISLSKPNDLTYTETGLANATAYQYDGRYQTDDGAWSAWSDVKTATTGAGGGGAAAPTFDQLAQSSTNLSGTSAGAKNWTPDLAGVDAGDVVLVHAVHMNGEAPGGFPAMLAPGGYHLLESDESDAGDWSKAWWWFHIWEAGDVDPTFTADNSQASYRITGQAAVYKSNATGINKIDHTVASSGTSTGGSSTTLQNSGATWTPNQWANHLLYLPASGRYAMIASNTETQLSLRSDIGLTIGSGLSYEIRALKFAKQRNTSSSSSVTAPGLTPAQQPCRLVSMFLGSDGNTNVSTENLTVPGSMSKRGEVHDNNNWTFAALADEVRTNLSATGTRVATFPSVAPESWGASIVIRGG